MMMAMPGADYGFSRAVSEIVGGFTISLVVRAFSYSFGLSWMSLFIQRLLDISNGGFNRQNALLVILVFSRLAHWPYLHRPGFPEPSGTDIVPLDNAPRALSEIR